MAYVVLSPSAKQAMIAGPGLAPLLDGGAAGARLSFYAGTIPSPGGTPAGGTPAGALQAEVQLPQPSGTTSGGTWTSASGVEAIRVASDTMTWARLQVDGVWVMDLDVSVFGGSGAVQLDAVTGYLGGTVTLLAGSIGF